MHRERWREIEEAFDAVLERPEDERSAWLASRYGDDPELRNEVAGLLAAHARPGGLLDRRIDAVRPSATDRVKGRRIGPYRMLRELGRGGMGVVYLAERDDGQYRQRVAIKLLRSSPEADEMHARFLSERQILASLAHPNVAQLLDGGITDGQLPYLVMEYVDGLPITEHCDRHRLDVRARLALFQRVCAAVHHAHQNLVIHRDLKPSNIYVTDDGHVKLLDFGIAKLLNPNLAPGGAPVTRTALRLMTPDYASPEQVRGDVLTTASDIYALGVVLYELLTGHRPYRVSGGAGHELAELVCEREPPLPSSSVMRTEAFELPDGTRRVITAAAVGAARDSSPERLRRELRGDLDGIVMMALRKERERRYGSVDLLAADIQRHLDGLPVIAHRDGRLYRLQKFLRRHRVEAAAALLVAVSLVGGVAVSLRQAAVAREERDRAATARLDAEQSRQVAETSRAEAEEVTAFVLDLFRASDPRVPQDIEITARDLLRQGVRRAAELERPLVRARMQESIGRVYLSLGEYGEARALLQQALALRVAALGERHADVAGARALLANVLTRQGAYAEAEREAAASIAILETLHGPDHVAASEGLLQLAGLAIYRGDLDEAERLTRRALVLRTRAYGEVDSLVANGLADLAGLRVRRGDLADAERMFRRVLEIRRRVFGERHAEVAYTLKRMGDLHYDHRGEVAPAESLYRAALEMQESLLGAGDVRAADTRSSLAAVLADRGAHAPAESLALVSLATARRVYGADNRHVADALSRHAGVLRRAGRLAEGERIMREAVAMYRRHLGDRHTVVAGALSGLAELLVLQGELAPAEAAAREALEIRRERLGEVPLVAEHAMTLARIVERRGRMADAAALLLDARRIVLRHGESHPQHAVVLERLAELHERWKRTEDAARYRAELVALRTRPPG